MEQEEVEGEEIEGGWIDESQRWNRKR